MLDENRTPDCIVCAAGASKRLNEWKQSLPWLRGSTPTAKALSSSLTGRESWLLDAAVSAALEAGCRVILVTGYRGHELEARYANWSQVEVVCNSSWERGMVSSIKAALSHLRSEWFFIVHGDMPLIGPHWYQTLLAHRPPRVQKDAPVALRPMYVDRTTLTPHPCQSGKPGHPVLFSFSAIPLIQEAPEGESLKSVFTGCRVIPIETQDDSVQYDVDTLEQYIHAIVRGVGKDPQVREKVTAQQDLHSEQNRVSTVHLITGGQGVGKTSLLRRTAFKDFIKLAEQGYGSPFLFFMISQVQTARGEDGKAFGFDTEGFYLDPEGKLSFFREPLCRKDPAYFPIPIPFGPYYFHPGTFASLVSWVDRAFGKYAPITYGYMDELGKLELDQHEGLWPLFERVVLAMSRANSHAGTAKLVCTVRQDRVYELAAYLNQRGLSVDITELK